MKTPEEFLISEMPHMDKIYRNSAGAAFFHKQQVVDLIDSYAKLAMAEAWDRGFKAARDHVDTLSGTDADFLLQAPKNPFRK